MTELTKCPFVGREDDFKTIDEGWSVNRILGIYGIRAVGKSRLVEEYMTRRQRELITVDLSGTSDTVAVYTILCAALNILPPETSGNLNSWLLPLVEHLKEISANKCVVVVMDNAEDVIEGPTKDSFMKFCTKLVKECQNIKLVLTSTTRMLFSQLGKVYLCHKVEPLCKTDTVRLLEHAAPGVDFGPYKHAIADLSEGLPLLVLMIGAELGHISPAEMVNLLLSCRLETLTNLRYKEECRVGSVYKNFIRRLSEIYQDYLTTLDYIPGTFNDKEAEGMLEIGSVAFAKQNALKPILSRHVLNYESSSKRFNIQGILREIIRSEFVVKNLPEIRRRYCKTFTTVMKEIAHRMGTAEYTRAMSEFAVEQPNLSKLLKDVTYTKEDTYHFFIEVASSCTELIEVYMANEGQQFYGGCLQLADQYGQDTDKATVYIAIGSMETLTKGDLQTGADNYRQALAVLEDNDAESLQLATLYQKLGWNVFKQGDCEEAIRLYKKSFNISNKFVDEASSLLSLQTMGYIGVIYVVLGNFDEAQKYHFPSLRKCEEKHGRIHPKTGNAYNRIGLFFDQRGDQERGLEYFRQGLEIKQESKAPPISIVYSLSNVANSLNGLDRFEEAHRVVDEAFEILESQKLYMLDGFSLMYNTRGKIYARQGEWSKAADAFERTVEITRQIERNSYIYMKRLVNLAEMLEKVQKYKYCLQIAIEAIALKDVSAKAVPHNFIAIECLQCMARVYNTLGKRRSYVKALFNIERECYRLEKVCMEQYNEREVRRIAQIRGDLQEQFQELNL